MHSNKGGEISTSLNSNDLYIKYLAVTSEADGSFSTSSDPGLSDADELDSTSSVSASKKAILNIKFSGSKEEIHRVASSKHEKFSYPEIIEIELNAPIVKFAFVGCAGTGGEKQKKVADAIRKEKGLLCLFLGGDNVYDDGVSSEVDPQFKEKIYDVYSDVLIFSALGNHEHCLYKKGKIIRGVLHSFVKIMQNPLVSDDKAYSGAHFYVEHASVSAKKTSTIHETINIGNIQYNRLMMSGSYYAVKFVHHDKVVLKILVLDSTTFLRPDEDEKNEGKHNCQQQWFLQQQVDAHIIIWHHPVIATAGNRFKDCDEWELYKDSIPKEDRSGSHGDCINEWIEKNCKDLKPLIFFNAHDHHSSVIWKYSWNRDRLQLTAGGGGGSNQPFRNTKLIGIGAGLLFATDKPSYCLFTHKDGISKVDYRDTDNQSMCCFKLKPDKENKENRLVRVNLGYHGYGKHRDFFMGCLQEYLEKTTRKNDQEIEKIFQLFIFLTSLTEKKVKSFNDLKTHIERMAPELIKSKEFTLFFNSKPNVSENGIPREELNLNV